MIYTSNAYILTQNTKVSNVLKYSQDFFLECKLIGVESHLSCLNHTNNGLFYDF